MAVGLNDSFAGKSVAINASSGAVKVWPGSLANDALNGVACPTETSCVAVSDEAVATVAVSNAAAKVTGTIKPPANGIVALNSIACAGSTVCYAVGFEGNRAASSALLVKVSKAGKILSTAKASGTGFGAIACPSASICLLSEHTKTAQLDVPLDAGRLAAGHPFPANTYVQEIRCYAAKVCYALGGHISTGISHTNELFPLNPLTGAVGKVISLGSFNGDGFACYSATQCIVAGFTGEGAVAVASVVTVTKGKAGTFKHFAGDEPFDTDACATASLCYAVGPGKAVNTATVVRI